MPSKERHEWREDTEEGVRVYKAVLFAREWKFASAMKGSRREKPEWEDIEEVSDELWEKLREVLFRKYQRKRCPWKFIADIDKRLGHEVDTLRKSRSED
ncbi:hypothetical protein [Rubritalea marina]|uniref:hypothetical protein n=1 Tax=Rubritalea marina TaxID=361055 RepID=UPI00037204D7|nr:hypothetical protein [Rubritalea marina]